MQLTTLTLQNFRQFKKKTLSFEKPWTFIVAPNTKGKSTVIEAIYMLCNGQSPWTNGSSNIIKITSQKSKSKYEAIQEDNCRIEGKIQSNGETKTLSLYLQVRNGSTTKQYKVDNSPTTRNKFTQHLHCVLFSPDLIDRLMFEPKQRRDFLDEHLSSLDLDYAPILSSYNKVLRQRNSLLRLLAAKKRPPNGNTLEYWTEQLLDLGTQVITSRFDFIHKVNSENPELYPATITYQPRVLLHDIGELADESYVREEFEKQLESRRSKELLAGTTLTGPHRDDWYLTDKMRNLHDFGSRGEKRMAIADVIFKVNNLLGELLESQPILLLDDISSELDEGNTKKLFEEKIDENQQVVVTTTSKDAIIDRQQTNIVQL